MANSHESEPRITRDVYHDCVVEIQEWIDVGAMQPQLMKHGIIQSQDDIHRITHGPPSERRNYVYCKVCQMRNGFQLLYRCLRESQENQMGHKDAADVLEEKAQVFAAAATPPLRLHASSPNSSFATLPPSLPSLPSLPPTPPTVSLATTSIDCARWLPAADLHTPIEEEREEAREEERDEEREEERGRETGLPSFSDLLAAQDFHTLYKYTLDNTNFDLDIASLKGEEELLRYISRFTVAIFNSRDRSANSCLPGVLIAGVSFTVSPNTPDPVTRGEVVMTMVDKADFEEKLQEQLRRCVGCHGSDRLLSDEELGCVKMEFAPVSNHGNSLFTVYVCPTWEICEGNLYFMWNQSRPETMGGVGYWVRGDRGCGQLLYDRVQDRATQLLSAWQQQ